MFKHFIYLFLLVVLVHSLFAQKEDSVKIYYLAPIEVKAKNNTLSQTFTPTEKDNLTNLLNTNGFHLIRKGTFFAHDIYGDGFKRSDIEVVVDGERYHSACPNRMDSPLTRVNPLEISEIEMVKNSAVLQSGLGGKINFIRKEPEEPVRIKTSLSAVAGHSQNTDAAVSIEGYKQRLSLRYAAGTPYEDADSRSFKDLYGYKDNYDYKLAEITYNGKQNDFNYGLGFSYTENVSFPYLQMDEKFNRVFNGHVGYKNNKLYFNYTSHLMDNTLRVNPMLMATDAKNLTIGITGEFYEVYYRNWKADNLIETPMMTINNKLIPNASQISASVSHKMKLSFLNISAKAGLAYTKLGENDLSLYKEVDSDAKDNSFFPLLGLSLGFTESLTSELNAGVSLDASTETPSLESQFISVKKPMGNPAWVGNTNLDVPVKSSLKGYLFFDPIFLEVYATNIWNYVELAKVNVNRTKYQTYQNVDAYILGFNMELNYRFINFSANYSFAKNKTNGEPLSEIAPLTVKTLLTSPTVYGFNFYLRHTYNDAQTRVDPFLNESATPQWNKVDIGASYEWNYLTLSVEVENLTNEKYYQHLSYLRNPFSSGVNVLESGRVFRFNVKLNNLL